MVDAVGGSSDVVPVSVGPVEPGVRGLTGKVVEGEQVFEVAVESNKLLVVDGVGEGGEGEADVLDVVGPVRFLLTPRVVLGGDVGGHGGSLVGRGVVASPPLLAVTSCLGLKLWRVSYSPSSGLSGHCLLP